MRVWNGSRVLYHSVPRASLPSAGQVLLEAQFELGVANSWRARYPLGEVAIEHACMLPREVRWITGWLPEGVWTVLGAIYREKLGEGRIGVGR